MKLNPININFGKQYVASCRITTSENERRKASIYKYNPEDIDDVTEIKDSPNTDAIKCNFIKMQRGKIEFPQAYEFYAVRDNQTGEIAACAQLSNRYNAPEKENLGFYTLIDKIGISGNYTDSLTPLLGYVAHFAKNHFKNNIATYAYFNEGVKFKLKEHGYRKTEAGSFVMNEEGFDESILKAEKENRLKIKTGC